MLSKSLKAVRRGFTLVEIMIVVLIIGILLAIAIPNFVRAREQSRAKSCSANLKQISSAMQQYAMDNKLKEGSTPPAVTQLAPTYIHDAPVCPSTGVPGDYTMPTNIDGDPTCVNTSTTYPHTVTGQ